MPLVCSPTARGIACTERTRAVAAGRFLMSFKREGWVWKDCAHPDLPWAICPWCGGELPTPTTIYERIRHSLHERED